VTDDLYRVGFASKNAPLVERGERTPVVYLVWALSAVGMVTVWLGSAWLVFRLVGWIV